MYFTRHWRGLLIAGAVAVLLTHPMTAHAAGAGGGGAMPWDTPLQKISQSLTTTFAGALALIAFAVAGATLIFGGEISEFIRRLIYVIMVVSLLVGVNAALAAFGITGAVI